MSKKSKLLLGIVLDCSSSMRKSWNNNNKSIPKIESIHDEIINHFINISETLRINRDRYKHLFVLGMGFVRPLRFYNTIVQYGYEDIEDESELIETKQNDIVCDILGLYEIIPNKNDLDKSKKIIEEKWKDLLDQLLKSTNEKFTIGNLIDILRDNFIKKENKKLKFNIKYILYNFVKHKSLKNLFINLFNNLNDYFMNLNIDKISIDKSIKFSNRIHNKTEEILDQKTHEYIEYITKELSNFLSDQIAITLDLIVIGHNPINSIKHFDYNKLEERCSNIYIYLKNDVENIIGYFWKIFTDKDKYSLNEGIDIINMIDMKDPIIRYMRSTIWIKLKQTMEHTIRNLVLNLFETQFRERLSYWIGMSSSREVIKPIHELSIKIPLSSELNIYSDEFMFGIAAIKDTIDKSSIRFFDKKYDKWKKLLIIISDGDFTIKNTLFDPITAAIALRDSQIVILSLCVTDQDIMMKGRLQETAPKGSLLLYEMASMAKESPWIIEELKRINIKISDDERLFIHINQSHLLDNILKTLLIEENGDS